MGSSEEEVVSRRYKWLGEVAPRPQVISSHYSTISKFTKGPVFTFFLYSLIVSIISPLVWIALDENIGHHYVDSVSIVFEDIIFVNPSDSQMEMKATMQAYNNGPENVQFAKDGKINLLLEGNEAGYFLLPAEFTAKGNTKSTLQLDDVVVTVTSPELMQAILSNVFPMDNNVEAKALTFGGKLPVTRNSEKKKQAYFYKLASQYFFPSASSSSLKFFLNDININEANNKEMALTANVTVVSDSAVAVGSKTNAGEVWTMDLYVLDPQSSSYSVNFEDGVNKNIHVKIGVVEIVNFQISKGEVSFPDSKITIFAPDFDASSDGNSTTKGGNTVSSITSKDLGSGHLEDSDIFLAYPDSTTLYRNINGFFSHYFSNLEYVLHMVGPDSKKTNSVPEYFNNIVVLSGTTASSGGSTGPGVANWITVTEYKNFYDSDNFVIKMNQGNIGLKADGLFGESIKDISFSRWSPTVLSDKRVSFVTKTSQNSTAPVTCLAGNQMPLLQISHDDIMTEPKKYFRKDGKSQGTVGVDLVPIGDSTKTNTCDTQRPIAACCGAKLIDKQSKFTATVSSNVLLAIGTYPAIQLTYIEDGVDVLCNPQNNSLDDVCTLMQDVCFSETGSC
eukprot:Nk52_evm20s230 gene=Nk52_evmTU20s230